MQQVGNNNEKIRWEGVALSETIYAFYPRSWHTIEKDHNFPSIQDIINPMEKEGETPRWSMIFSSASQEMELKAIWKSSLKTMVVALWVWQVLSRSVVYMRFSNIPTMKGVGQIIMSN